MSKEAAEYITEKGLGRGSRIAIALVAGPLGMFFLLAAHTQDRPAVGYGAAVSFFLVSLACVTRERARQLFGSLLGAELFGLSVFYVISVVSAGGPVRGWLEPLSCFLFIGLPGLTYAGRTRFGFAVPKTAPLKSLDGERSKG